MFAVFGSGLGPDKIEIVDEFPLPLDFFGTSVQVTVDGTTVDCIMIFTLERQVAAVLPSNTPLGDGTLTVSFNGETSPPIPVTVVGHSFGIFAINQGGSGPGVFTDLADARNTLVQTATPGSLWSIWGTGVGAVAGDERGGALPGDQSDINVQVLVGGIPAEIFYRGRSGCCTGADQIFFYIPEGVTGCYVPVVVVVEGVPSNFTTISISENGTVCSDVAGGFTAADLAAAESNGSIRLGTVNLNRTTISFTPPFAAQSFDFTTDSASAGFGRFDLTRLIASQGIAGISTFGACVVYQFIGSGFESTDPILPAPLDAGPSLMLSGPGKTAQITKNETGFYSEQLSGGLPSFLTSTIKGLGLQPQQQSLPGFLDPGDYTVVGSGGTDVGAFSSTITIPPALDWTNRDQINSIPRSQDLKINWTGGGENESVQIFGFSAASVQDEEFSGALFFCRERVSAGMFSVPTVVLQSLPPSTQTQGVDTGILGVGTNSDGVRFDASGLDFGIFSHTDLSLKTVGFE